MGKYAAEKAPRQFKLSATFNALTATVSGAGKIDDGWAATLGEFKNMCQI